MPKGSFMYLLCLSESMSYWDYLPEMVLNIHLRAVTREKYVNTLCPLNDFSCFIADYVFRY